MNHSAVLPPTSATLLTHPFEDKRVGHPFNTSANIIFTTLVLKESNLKKKIVIQKERTGEVLIKGRSQDDFGLEAHKVRRPMLLF
jgi:hypothetical protein